MPQTYMDRRRAVPAPPAAQSAQTGVPGPSMAELAAGAAPSQEQLGSRVDLPGAVREKMEAAFGTGFSQVNFYQSQAVADAGANAVTMGQSVAFAPGKLDPYSAAGQELIGHELSHVVSQARGERSGRGLLRDPGLEARADREGQMAAAGEPVYSGPVTPFSASGVSPVTCGLMQAQKGDEEEIQMERNRAQKQRDEAAGVESDPNLITELPSRFHFIQRSRTKRALREQYGQEAEARKTASSIPSPERVDRERPTLGGDTSLMLHLVQLGNETQAELASSEEGQDLVDVLQRRYNKNEYKDIDVNMGNASARQRMERVGQGDANTQRKAITRSRQFNGLNYLRSMAGAVNEGRKMGMDDDQITTMYDNLLAGQRNDLDLKDEAAVEAADQRFDQGARQLKKIYLNHLRSVQKKYGVSLSQMHPEDVIRQGGKELYKDMNMMQDCAQLIQQMPEIFDPEDKEDKEYERLSEYYNSVLPTLFTYGSYHDSVHSGQEASVAQDSQRMYTYMKMLHRRERDVAAHLPSDVQARPMGAREQEIYRRDLRERFGQDNPLLTAPFAAATSEQGEEDLETAPSLAESVPDTIEGLQERRRDEIRDELRREGLEP